MFATSVALTLLSSIQVVHSLGTSLSLYTDQGCSTPSTTNPNVTLGLNVCAVTTGMESFVIDPTPCTSGNVQAWMFLDVACGNPSSNWYHGANGNNYCYATYKGAMAAVMLTCDGNTDETTPSRPTATMTIAVGEVANAPTSTAAGGSTGATAVSSNSSSTTNTDASQPSSTTSSKASGWNGLDQGTRIGIIVALSMGIPAIILATWQLCVAIRR
ncbi:hypothetical protein LSUE1_G005365 [Lachnellula suecica]|uniref:Cyanovirin-N domain-containing protein n=1 Tax=Lachnellula suecica TaxID=602035 RepID=A0A8T9BYY4_9HELO|nr:hypothetical protein LSUE1_G005365 [Lachnellula suecica]